MRPRLEWVKDSRDLQVELAGEVQRAIDNAATQLMLRRGDVSGVEARWTFAECVVLSIFTSLHQLAGEERLHQAAQALAAEAIASVKQGRGVPLDRAGEGPKPL